MTELKPCPFCGGKGEILKSHNCEERPYLVICSNDECKASVGIFSNTKEEAIETWNRREGNETNE